ncbi:MAG: NADH-quinone oxidoreductase subunit J [Campylobacterota bacterium]|nr:NADH-quinone oxidoreductase subunit J [Campylobacterota bacterium]
MLESSIFYILALFLLGGSLGMVFNRHSVFSAVSFMLAMIALAGMFALLQSSFLFLAQILVAVGAIVTLALLVIASVNAQIDNVPDEPRKNWWLLGSSILVLPFSALLITAIKNSTLSFAPLSEEFGSVRAVGRELFSEWVLPFELVSILLLIALVASIVISQRRMDHDA